MWPLKEGTSKRFMNKPPEEYQIDKLDMQILAELRRDARCSFLELSRKFTVSGGTIHQRVEKLKVAGIIRAFTVDIDTEKLGYGVTTLIGIHLVNAGDTKEVFSRIEKFREVTEVYYTTGTYAAIIKVEVRDILGLQVFLASKLQSILQIQSTESYVVLSTVFRRSVI
jgi:Lrp/AsnC family transcriptional regulator for asnA, asnC and gidA